MAIQLPLTVHVLYHKEYSEGSKVYSALYKMLCRDSHNPFSSGMDIPVYFHTNEDGNSLQAVPTNLSAKTFILILVDQNMYLSKEWKDYVNTTLLKQSDGNVLICAVSLYKYAFEFSTELGACQFFSFSNESLFLHWGEFQTRLYDNLIRFVNGDGMNQLRIFISHSKRDKDTHGERLAKDLRDYILQRGTKLSSFFDVNNIMEGENFESQILDSADKAIMIVIFSETYSSREWCIKEILQAKKNNRPVIVVFDIEGDVDRVFPYIGNVPATIYKGDWSMVINLLLRTTLYMTYQKQLLSNFPETLNKVTSAPDAYCFSNIPKDIRNKEILYPEPPISYDELEVLYNINGEKFNVMTPMQYNANGCNLKQRSIAISISESEDQHQNGIGQDMLDDITLEILRHILIANGKIVYGGNLQQDGFTERFRELSFQYGQYRHLANEEPKNPEDERYMTSFIAWPFYLTLNNDRRSEFQHCRVDIHCCKPCDIVSPEEARSGVKGTEAEKREKCARSLTVMREEMESSRFSDGTGDDKELLARIFIGGKTSSYSGSKPGILEEFEISLQHNRPVFLLGGFGGETKKIIDHLNRVPGRDIQGLRELNFEDLNTGITDPNEIDALCNSTNILDIVPIILKALNNLANQ